MLIKPVSDEMSYDDGINVDVSCVPRIWIYAIISIAGLIFSGYLMCLCLSSCIFIREHVSLDLVRGNCRHWCRLVLSLALFLAVVLILTLLVVLPVRYTTSSSFADFNNLDPADTRVISISNSICEKIAFNFHPGGDQSVHSAYLYILDSVPKLAGYEEPASFIVNSTFDDDTFHFHLHQGSQISITGCVRYLYKEPHGSISFFIIKGRSNYDKWKDNPFGPYAYEVVLRVTALCETAAVSAVSYAVTSDDIYYITYNTDDDDGLIPNVLVRFNRTRYEIGNSTVLDSCFTSSDHWPLDICTVDVPFSGATPLFVLTPAGNENVDWNTADKVSIDIACVPRTWMYVIFSLAILIPGLFFYICIMYKCRNKCPSINARFACPKCPTFAILRRRTVVDQPTPQCTVINQTLSQDFIVTKK